MQEVYNVFSGFVDRFAQYLRLCGTPHRDVERNGYLFERYIFSSVDSDIIDRWCSLLHSRTIIVSPPALRHCFQCAHCSFCLWPIYDTFGHENL